ncbi:hypothetical protein SAMN00120144_3083 [Hymenobacter roseosalivarius DSM 11622]|uniref:Uncharacterized protein n=1 Tax=Hymenobacter roseosalivarius DSM 11622 TaxID=645990 RepID=A0A1W1W587_9BACT|nr:hypothetical protein [Hymenobacter roseosalivarius]SMC00703.1 hypothetical protein SAMN00120144_3083 [Hymenobacter roseosalivarius DSM 11622]
MKKLFFLVSCLLVLGSSPAWAWAETDIVVVRVDLGLRRIIITRGENQSELMKIDVRGFPEKTAVHLNEAYYSLIKKLGQEGYVVQQRLADGEGSTTLLFVKATAP